MFKQLWLPGLSTPVKRLARPHHLFQSWAKLIGPDGETLWDEGGWKQNLLHDDGEQYFLSRSFCQSYSGFESIYSILYAGLDARGSLAEADTPGSLSGEPTAGGNYARQGASTLGGATTPASFTIEDSGAGYFRAVSPQFDFYNNSASTAWPNVTNRFLTTDSAGATGLLLCSLALGTTIAVAPLSHLTFYLRVGMSE